MRKRLMSFEKVGAGAVLLLAFLIVAALTYYAGKYTYSYPLDYSVETIHEYSDSMRVNVEIFLLVAAVLAMVGILLSKLSGWSEGLSEKVIRIFAIAETVVVGVLLLIWVLTSNVMPYWDQYQVYLTALDFMTGDFSDMSGYMDMNPQQYGLAFLYEVIFTIVHNDSYKVIECCNVLCIMAIIWVGFLLTKRWTQNSVAGFFYLIGIGLCFPLFLYSTYVYGDVMCVTAGILSVWGVTVWCDTGKKRYAALVIAALCIGTLARRNTLVIVIAVVIVLLVRAIGRLKWQPLVFALLVAVLPVASVELVEFSYELRSGESIGTGIPAVLYIAMGMQQDEDNYGMYSGYNTSIYGGIGERDSEICTQIGMEAIQERLSEFMENKAYAREFYRRKLLGQWNDHTFSSLNNTAHFDGEAEGFVQNVYYGDIQEFLLSFMERYIFVVYALAAIGLLYWFFRKKEIHTALAAVILVGGFLFSILWEAKGRYVLPYVVVLIPYAAVGMWVILQTVERVVLAGRDAVKNVRQTKEAEQP